MSSRERSPASTERTPLLPREDDPEAEPTKKRTRWPSFVALGILVIAVICAIVFGFATPAAVEEYVKEAISFEPSALSIDAITNLGIRARVKGDFYLDASKVSRKPVRDLGRFATWIAKEVEIGQANLEIYLPEYDGALLGTVQTPPMVINIRNGQHTFVDIVADVQPGDVDGLRSVALDFMHGKQTLDVKAIATVPVKSGILSLGTQTVTQSMTVEGGGDMKIPDIDIANLKVAEYGMPAHPEGLVAHADVSAINPYPVQFDVPPLAFDIMLPDCAEQPLNLGNMNTDLLHILPNQLVTVSVTGFMKQLPAALTTTCPGTRRSPLDMFVGSYLSGNDTKIYVKGGQQDPERTPQWIGDILGDILLPVAVPSQPFDNAIKNFSMSNVQFSLPDYVTRFDPEISATINVVVGLPEGINIDVSVNRVRATAGMFFEGEKLGDLDLHEWQQANSSKAGNDLLVQSKVVKAPLKVTSQSVFSKVLQKVVFGGNGLEMEVQAVVDVDTTTVLGEFEVRQIPSKGKITIDPIGGGGSGAFKHEIKDIQVADSSPEKLIMRATVEVMNPTDYSAHIPYVNISVWCNDTQLGYAWGAFDIVPGKNTVVADASLGYGAVGAEFLSQYISGYNVSMTLKTHPGSIPGLPDPQMAVDVPVPHTFGKFMKETTMHIFSSTATFLMFSPLPMTILSIDAKAFYKGTDIGEIRYDDPIEIKPGDNETPSLPVDWNFNGGFDMIKKALGGNLKLDAHANVTVRIGEFEETIWYEANGMGAKIEFFMDEIEALEEEHRRSAVVVA